MYLCLLTLNSCKVNLVQNIFYIEKSKTYEYFCNLVQEYINIGKEKLEKQQIRYLVSPILASLLVHMRKASQYLKEQRFGKTSVFKSVSRLWFTREIAEAEMKTHCKYP